MALEVFVSRSPSGSLVPAFPGDSDKLSTLPKGRVFKATLVQPRNLRFHRKGFALLQVAFELWAEGLPVGVEYKGEHVAPDFDRFRKDLTILAGFYEPHYDIRGNVRLTAKSLSFSSMDEEEFGRVYSALLDTVLAKVLKHVDKDELEAAVERLIQFA